MKTRIPKNLVKLAELYPDFVEELDQNEVVNMSSQRYDIVTTPLKQAARKTGLKVSGGRIFTRNNWNCCGVLFFPIEVDYFPFDPPSRGIYLWKKTLCAEVKYEGNMRRLRKVDEILTPDGGIDSFWESIKAFCTERLKPLSKDDLFELQNAYGESLRLIGFEGVSPKNLFAGWGYNNIWKYFPPKELEDIEIRSFSKEEPREFKLSANQPVRMIESVERICTSFEYVYMAATLFSLCKRVFSRFHNKEGIDFCLHVGLEGSGGEKDPQSRRLLERFTHMWCNYRPWKKRKKKKGRIRKFWNLSNQTVILAAWNHFNFPFVVSDSPSLPWDCEHEQDKYHDLPIPTKKRVNQLAQASCLPVLFTFSKPGQRYPAADCLKLTWSPPGGEKLKRMIDQFEPICENKENIWHRHWLIVQFYVTFIQALETTIKEAPEKAVRKRLGSHYRRAVLDLGVLPKNASVEQRQKAYLLSAMYLARDLLGASTYAKDIDRAISGLKRHLSRDASLSDFAAFVRQCQEPASEYRAAFCYQDRAGIYLHYKGYWTEFKRYCVQRGVKINLGEAAFRRNVLKSYLTPQYEPSDQLKHPRYDYRKKVGDQVEIVLNLSPKILRIQ